MVTIKMVRLLVEERTLVVELGCCYAIGTEFSITQTARIVHLSFGYQLLLTLTGKCWILNLSPHPIACLG